MSVVCFELEEPSLEIVVLNRARKGRHTLSVPDLPAWATLDRVRRGTKSTLVLLTALGLVAGCRASAPAAESGGEQREATATPGAASEAKERFTRPAWGAPTPRLGDAALMQSQLERRPMPVDRPSSGDDAALWARMRVGGGAAVDTAATMLDGGYDGGAFAAIGLLGESEPPAMLKTLERPLWARYALARDETEAEGIMFALARVGGAFTVDHLVEELRADDGVLRGARGSRLATALALVCARGVQISSSARDQLLVELSSEQVSRRAESARAVARCLASSPEEFADEEVRTAFATKLASLTSDVNPEVQARGWRALFVLGEVPDAHVSTVQALLPTAERMADEWVSAYERARAMATTAEGRRSLLALLEAVATCPQDERAVHVVVAALGELRARAESLESVASFVQGRMEAWKLEGQAAVKGPRDAKVRALLRCELRALESVAARDAKIFDRCEGPLVNELEGVVASLRVDVLAKIITLSEGRRGMDALFELADDPSPIIAAPALSSLSGIDHARVNAILRAALERDDPGVLAAAAACVAARADDGRLRDETAKPILVSLIQRHADAPALEARLSALRALGRLIRGASPEVPAGKERAPRPLAPEDVRHLQAAVLPLIEDANATVRARARDALAGLPAFEDALAAAGVAPTTVPDALVTATEASRPPEGLRVRTDAGRFDIDLRGFAAGIQQRHLGALAATGFYDGLRWHRVVPGFVAQGGDPRGDGYGGPGYVVPCETSNLSYQRGSVGIATAGRDTGGSQLFVTHVATPHLDGRYTLVGQVSPATIEVVDRILPGDRITSIQPIARWGDDER